MPKAKAVVNTVTVQKPVSHVVVVSLDAPWLDRHVAGINEAARKLDEPFELRAFAARTIAEALKQVTDDADVQIVIIDYGASDPAASAEAAAPTAGGSDGSGGGGGGGGGGSGAPVDLEVESVARLSFQVAELRPEVSVYVTVEDDEDKLAVERMASNAITAYFDRDEDDFAGWARIVAAEIAEKSETPFYDALRRYVRTARDSWHTPGHSSGDAFKGSAWVRGFFDFLGENTLRADLSVSVPELDSLMHPHGAIKHAQDLAATFFGAKHTFFLTNGSSTANKVIFQTVLAPGEKLLLDRNCHKSVHHGVIMAGARPIYLDSSINHEFGIFGPVPRATILAAIEEHPDATALILTSCTYDGFRYDLKPIIEAAHAKGIKAIIDEAWYGHARCHPALRPTALECGADYVTHSTHKVGWLAGWVAGWLGG
jgi:hypothetical protein